MIRRPRRTRRRDRSTDDPAPRRRVETAPTTTESSNPRVSINRAQPKGSLAPVRDVGNLGRALMHGEPTSRSAGAALDAAGAP
jgi:hypothetical protein